MTYKVLIIGCGAIAGGYDSDRHPSDWPQSHAGAIARNDAFELIACVDPDEAAREAFAARWSVGQSAPAPEELDAAPQTFDLIVIASPTGCHAEQLEWALAMQPRAVFCEKPVASTLAPISAILGAFADAGVPLAINHTRRWAPDIEDLAGDISHDRWGALISAIATYSKGIVHNGTHMIDLLHALIGPLQLHSVGPARCDHWDDDPSVSAILTAQHDGDCAVHLVPGDSAAFAQFELALSYQYGEIAIRDGGARLETRRIQTNPLFPEYRQLGTTENSPGRYAEAMTKAYENLAEVIAGKAEPKCTGQTALAAHTLCDTIRVTALENLEKVPPQ